MKLLVDGFTESVEGLEEMWYLLMYHLGKDLHDITQPAPKHIAFTRVVTTAYQNGWIQELVGAAVEARPNVIAFQQVRTELQAVPVGPLAAGAVAPTPWEVGLIGGALPFIDRDPLRTAVRNLEENDWPRILVVQGGAGSGKTHTRHFVRYRADACKDRIVWIDLLKVKRSLPPGSHILPEHIAESLCNQLGLPLTLIPEREDEQYARWNLVFCDRLTAPLTAFTQRVWIFVDEFNSVLLPQATADFFKELATHVDAAMTAVRLMLLGYDDTLPLDAAQSAHKDLTERITDTHLAAFFRQVYGMRGGKAATDEELAAHVARVLFAVAANDPRPHKTIGEEAGKEARRILQGGG